MSSKKSFVWEYFKGFSADSGKCLRCNEVIIRKLGSTTAMASHLAQKHKITKPLEDNREDPIAKKRKITNQTINNFLKKESAEEIIAKCAATNEFMKPSKICETGDLTKDFRILEATNQKSSRLTDIQNALLSLQPTSTECERAFSLQKK